MAVVVPGTAPIPVPLPAPHRAEGFGDEQWQTLFALLDVVTPSIVVDSEATDDQSQFRITEAQLLEAYETTRKNLKAAPSLEKFKEYLRSRPTKEPAFVDGIKRLVGNLPKASQRDLSRVLSLLNTQMGSLLATGYRLPMKDQPLHVREAIFQSWGSSWISTFHHIAHTFMTLGKMVYSQVDPLFHELINYTDHEQDYKPGPAFDYDFMQFPSDREPVELNVDVVIVGSGCGGGVCAKILAEAGHDVLVVDKGYYFTPSQLPMTGVTANQYLFESGATCLSDDGCVKVIAGSNWGGGGTVNWSVALQLQGFVRQEWADEGLDFFMTQEFQNCMDRVCEVMGVSEEKIRHTHAASVLLDGARKLGWAAKPCPQNTNGEEHSCGRCHHGCGSGKKQGPAVCWLPAASRAGARFIEGMDVTRVIFDERHPKVAIGIEGKWTSRGKDGGLETPESERIQRAIRVNAKKVIVAAGTLNSPLLLLRSGLKNPQIGRNLHLHPVVCVRATFDEDLRNWEGSIITSVCTSFENLDGKGHGVKLETSLAMPIMLLVDHPYDNGLQWKIDALRTRQMSGFISLVRDRDSGQVYPDPDDGRPRVAYTASSFDRANILAGLVALAKMCYVQGATEIWSGVPGLPSFKRTSPARLASDTTAPVVGDEEDFDQGINDPEFVAWIKLIETTGLDSPFVSFTNAHQMGSCRMSARPRDGVVDPKGKVWDTESLLVADASIFPSASGVNPMITNMAIADYIARGVSRELNDGN